MLACNLWDAFIGFGFEFPDIEDGPNAMVCFVLWPIGLPIVLLTSVSIICIKLKQRRLNRQEIKRQVRETKTQYRISQKEQIEKELEIALKEIEQEIKIQSIGIR